MVLTKYLTALSEVIMLSKSAEAPMNMANLFRFVKILSLDLMSSASQKSKVSNGSIYSLFYYKLSFLSSLQSLQL